jgi:hypothetical protein
VLAFSKFSFKLWNDFELLGGRMMFVSSLRSWSMQTVQLIKRRNVKKTTKSFFILSDCPLLNIAELELIYFRAFLIDANFLYNLHLCKKPLLIES